MTDSQPEPRPHPRYPVLKKLAGVLRALAWFSLALSVLTLIAMLLVAISTSDLRLAAAGLLAALYGALLFIYFLVLGESIQVALDIEENSRKTAQALEELMKSGSGKKASEGPARFSFE
ncbi:MAG: hypothetical protein QME66_10645 [Candidatus Eisenbacteria bacterium]|nr:hypothetical protein [Candidatus Eisenbacteria bacterium]